MDDSNDPGNAKKKRGLIRRVFGFLSATGRMIRSGLNIVFLIILFVFIASMFGGRVQPLPEHAFLRVAPAGILVEQLSYTDPLSQIMRQKAERPDESLISDLLEAIEKAAKDSRITGLVLELDYLAGGGISKLSEVGSALIKFKNTGKPIIAISSNYSQEQYYLASYADEIHINPMGVVMLTGYGAFQPYFKDAFDKLGINFHVFRVGAYKDAVEPFTRNNMSEPSRKQTLSWLGELWDAYTDQVEKNRKLPSGIVNNYIDKLVDNLRATGGNMAKLARRHTLVDHVSTRPEMLARLQSLAGVKAGEPNEYLHIDYQEYLFHQASEPEVLDSQGTVGLIIARGTIYDGEQPEGNIGSATMSTLLQTVRHDSSLDALVIRVDSPGGSAFGSDVIRQEIELIRQAGKPVVISMGSLAASGGYWIAANADQVWASPTTLTGSIGVFGLIPTFEKTLDTLGIHTDGVGTSPLAGIYRLDRPMSTAAEQIIQMNVDNIYQQFLALVADGRKLTTAQVHDLAQGRIWTGRQAKELGLVDKLGNLKDAMTAAASLAGLEKYETKEVEQELDISERIFKQLAKRVERLQTRWSHGGVRRLDFEASLKRRIVTVVRKFGLLALPEDPGGLYLQCLECDLFK